MLSNCLNRGAALHCLFLAPEVIWIVPENSSVIMYMLVKWLLIERLLLIFVESHLSLWQHVGVVLLCLFWFVRFADFCSYFFGLGIAFLDSCSLWSLILCSWKDFCPFFFTFGAIVKIHNHCNKCFRLQLGAAD